MFLRKVYAMHYGGGVELDPRFLTPTKLIQPPTFTSPSQFHIDKETKSGGLLAYIVEEWSTAEKKETMSVAQRWEKILINFFSAFPVKPQGLISQHNLIRVIQCLLEETGKLHDSPMGTLIAGWFVSEFRSLMMDVLSSETSEAPTEFAQVQEAIRNPKLILNKPFHELSPLFKEVVTTTFAVIREMEANSDSYGYEWAPVILKAFGSKETSKTIVFGLKDDRIYVSLSGKESPESGTIHAIEKKIGEKVNARLSNENHFAVEFLPFLLSKPIDLLLHQLGGCLPEILCRIQDGETGECGKRFYQNWLEIYEAYIREVKLDIYINVMTTEDVDSFFKKKYNPLAGSIDLTDVKEMVVRRNQWIGQLFTAYLGDIITKDAIRELLTPHFCKDKMGIIMSEVILFFDASPTHSELQKFINLLRGFTQSVNGTEIKKPMPGIAKQGNWKTALLIASAVQKKPITELEETPEVLTANCAEYIHAIRDLTIILGSDATSLKYIQALTAFLDRYQGLTQTQYLEKKLESLKSVYGLNFETESNTEKVPICDPPNFAVVTPSMRDWTHFVEAHQVQHCAEPKLLGFIDCSVYTAYSLQDYHHAIRSPWAYVPVSESDLIASLGMARWGPIETLLNDYAHVAFEKITDGIILYPYHVTDAIKKSTMQEGDKAEILAIFDAFFRKFPIPSYIPCTRCQSLTPLYRMLRVLENTIVDLSPIVKSESTPERPVRPSAKGKKLNLESPAN